VQDNYTQKHAQQGINEITQTALDDETRIDCPDINHPIDTDQNCGHKVNPQSMPDQNLLAKFLPLSHKQDDYEKNKKRPHNAVAEQLQGWYMVKPMPIDRK
jgi:hypothetical protein